MNVERPEPADQALLVSAKAVPGPLWLRALLFATGCVLLVVGIVGVILPGLPGVVFLILAAACFARSSPRFEAWLLAHRLLGPPVVQWRRTGAIPRSAKWLACTAMAISATMLWLSSAPLLAALATSLILIASAAYVLTRPNA